MSPATWGSSRAAEPIWLMAVGSHCHLVQGLLWGDPAGVAGEAPWAPCPAAAGAAAAATAEAHVHACAAADGLGPVPEDLQHNLHSCDVQCCCNVLKMPKQMQLRGLEVRHSMRPSDVPAGKGCPSHAQPHMRHADSCHDPNDWILALQLLAATSDA